MSKSFKGGLNSLLGETEDTKKKRGRPKVNTRETTKTSQAGIKEGETRATFILNENQLEAIKAIAYWDRVSIKDVLFQAIEDYLTKKKPELTKALNAYKNKYKE